MKSRFAGPLAGPLAALAALLLTAVAATMTPVLANDTPGNNGTVKIHEGPDENANGEVRNEPHVCTFHLHFYFADPEQAGTWEIQDWAPTGQKGTVVLDGTYDTQGDGEDRQPAEGVYELADGHYKLFWEGDDGKHDKMKVFWVDCAPTDTGGGGGDTGGGDTGGGDTGGTGGTGGSGQDLGSGGTGGVLGVTATPPPTDTSATTVAARDTTNWLPLVLGLVILAGLMSLVIPARSTMGIRRDR